MDFSEAPRLLDASPLRLELGIERLASGVLHVAARTDMHGCSGAMFDWFLSRILPALYVAENRNRTRPTLPWEIR
jgi:hypothetical protein